MGLEKGDGGGVREEEERPKREETERGNQKSESTPEMQGYKEKGKPLSWRGLG